MKVDPSEVPKYPVPDRPQPPPLEQPMVYVYERRSWEYQVVAKSAAEPLPSEEELNTKGREGWELVGVAAVAGNVSFFFKRARA